MADDSVMIGAVPAANDPIHQVSSEQVAHMTLLFFGPANGADMEAIRAAVAQTVQEFKPVTVKVLKRDTLGDDKADVLMLDPGDLRAVRSALLANSAVRAAFNAYTQYPMWTPHLTVGYPDTPATGEPGRTITFDRIALWTGDYEGPDFPLGAAPSPVLAAVVRTPAGAKKYGQPIGSVITRDASQVVKRAVRAVTVPAPHKGHVPTDDEVAEADRQLRARSTNDLDALRRGAVGPAVYLDAAGYNERPTVLSTRAFNAFQGKTIRNYSHGPEDLSEFWRGTIPFYSSASRGSDKKLPDPYVNLTTAAPTDYFIGYGIYSNGTHIGNGSTASDFANFDRVPKKSIRRSNGAIMMRIKIHPDARVVKYSEIPVMADPVEWVVKHGYDVVDLSSTLDNAAGAVVINRSVMVVEEIEDEVTGRVASAGAVAVRGLDVSAGGTDDPGLGSSASGLPGEGRGGVPQALGASDRAHRRPVVAAGDSWRWQLRDQNGQWVKMGGKVKWFSMGLTHYGVVTGSPSPDVASVREDTGGREYHVPSVGLARQEDRLTLPGETPKPPAKSVTPDYQVKYPRGTNEGQIVATVPGEADPVGVLRWDYTADPPVVIDVSVDERYRRRGIASAMFRLAKKNESRLQHSDVLTDEGRAFAGGVTAAGDSWRWQLRDRNGKWIEMGSEVRYLVRGLYRQGIVIGSPSPGMADVHEHITELVRTIPSSRLEVVKSAADVVERTFKAGKVKTDLTDNPALVDLVERAQESGTSLADWGEYLVPDEYKSIRENLKAIVPRTWSKYGSMDPIRQREAFGSEIWDLIKGPATELGFDEDTGPIYARGIGIKILERLERENMWTSSTEYHTGLASPLNDVRVEGRVAIATTVIPLLNMLENGDRYMTQFEVGESGGYYDPDLRAVHEAALFGLHPDVNVEKRPVYGYVFTPGMVDSTGVEQYGGIRLVLKDSVRDRATMTVGDSLGTGAIAPVPMNGPDVSDKEAYMASSAIANTMRTLAIDGPDVLQEFDYFEAQIQGGVTLADVEEIVILDDGELEDDEVEHIRNLAEQYGIRVEQR